MRKYRRQKQVQASHTIVRYEQENNIKNKTNTNVKNKTEGKPATTKNKPLTPNQLQWQDNYWDAEIKPSSTKIKEKEKKNTYHIRL